MEQSLWSLLSTYLDVPVEDPVVRARRQSLLLLLLLIGVTGLLGSVQLVWRFSVGSLLILISTLVMTMALIWFTRQGHAWTPYVFLAFLLVAIPYAFADVLDSPVAVIFALPVVVVPLIAPPWLTVPVALVELGSMLVIRGGMRVQLMNVTLLGLLFGLLSAVSWLSSTMLMRAVQEAQRNADALSQANRELRENRAMLQARAQQLAHRAAYLASTATVARDAASELELSVEELLDRVVRLISEEFGVYHVGIFLLDEVREWAALRAASSPGGQRLVDEGHRLRVGDPSTVGYVTRHGLPRISLDVQHDAGVLFENPELSEARSIMTLPLRAGGDVIGALDMMSRESEAFSQEDADVLQALADLIGVVIRNAQYFDRLQASVEAERQAYGQMRREMWSALLRQRAGVGYRGTAQGVTPTDEGLAEEVERAVRAGDPVSGTPSSEGRVPLAMPIKSSGGQVIGVIDTYKPDGAGAWTEEERTLLASLSDRLGAALESAQFYEASQRRATRERLTREIADDIRSALTVEDAMKRAVRQVARVLRASEAVARLGVAETLMDAQEDV